MAASIQEVGFKIPVLARSSGEVVDGHLRLKGARKLGVNRSVTWTDWDEELVGFGFLCLRFGCGTSVADVFFSDSVVVFISFLLTGFRS